MAKKNSSQSLMLGNMMRHMSFQRLSICFTGIKVILNVGETAKHVLTLISVHVVDTRITTGVR